MRAWILLAAACSGGGGSKPIANTAAKTATAEAVRLVRALRDDTIVVGTMRPPGARTATLERRVIIAAPEDAVRLSRLGDAAALEELVALLDDPERAWAANAMLARLTQIDEKIVDIYMARRELWTEEIRPKARARWRRWLDAHRGRLAWDREAGAFVVREP